jgi:glutamate synthase (ferredoxin)
MNRSLYDTRFEHDACGVGFVARLSGGADHAILAMALGALGRLEHRGAVAADGKSGDGAGVLTQIPRRFFVREAARLGLTIEEGSALGVGMVFERGEAGRTRSALERALAGSGLEIAVWRRVPQDRGVLGETALREIPGVWQVLVAPGAVGAAELEQRLYLARKAFERSGDAGYVCSLSSRTIVYKALCVAGELGRFYPDLSDPLYETGLAIYHQRYSTNTAPSWEMAQPFRMLGHNGEINTLSANLAWMRVRAAQLPSPLHPLLPETGSDSAALDAAVELLERNGRDVAHAMAMLVTPAWEETGDELPPEVRAFYHSHAPLLEPWDGPAALAFTDGSVVGAALDRNGLRPLRYKVTSDGLVVAGSEAGVVELEDARVVEKGLLGPGQVLLVDTSNGRLLHNAEHKHWLARNHTAPRWTGVPLPDLEPGPVVAPDVRVQAAFGLTREDLQYVIASMADEGKEATWSMGDDAPIAPLAVSPRSIYALFRQRFAQVTNPAIDPLRERRVMSLRTWLGPRPSLFDESDRTRLFELASPVLDRRVRARLRAQDAVRLHEVDCTFAVAGGALETRVDEIAREAEAAVAAGAGLVVLTDAAVSADRAGVPMALAVGGVHQRLIGSGLRARAGLLVDAGDCWDVHHLAVLVGCGATVVHPWLLLDQVGATSGPEAELRVIGALEAGLRKVMSKMGISTVASYRGGQLFEALGLRDEVVERCFPGIPSRVGGHGFAALGAQVLARHRVAFGAGAAPELPDFGRIRFRRGDSAESHAWNPKAVRALQRAAGSARGRDHGVPSPDGWRELHEIREASPPGQLRDLLDLVPAGPEVPLDGVEPAESIARRFVSSAMSLGALSPEAHGTLTMAMNRLGARSNSGEGGEDPAVYAPGAADRRDNKVKQIASGRFGVTAQYLARAEELEIKIAQGSKPGEGGQLPGHKVTELIARLRHSQPGVPLISPPPHHDIYSIEDIAQLIHDLKAVNPRAAVGVKLVAQAGVGTVAAGVAKAYAEYIVVSGHSGGTGASALSSIKHAGAPWELGLAETQQVLVRNGLRARVRLRVDGGLVTARDVVVAALLGAEEFGFGTAPLVAMGCDMARQCHLNTCPAGIATQDPELRTRFRGSPENVVAYFLGLAGDIRALLGSLGFRTLEDAVGRVDLLRQGRFPEGIELDRMLAATGAEGLRCAQPWNRRPETRRSLDEQILDAAAPAIQEGRPFSATHPIRNSDRTVGARIAGEVALRWGDAGLAPATLDLAFTGSAGQSFGAFACRGLRLTLDGEANDYVGKGLSGGVLVLRPTGAARAASERNVVLGNVALYGATAGRLFAAGRAGQRFAVRSSGAVAVVEGVGDHGCEYMTGGIVVVLGKTGWNFGAGMTGGVAYVLDETGLFPARMNSETVSCARPGERDLAEVRALVAEHAALTGSEHASRLLGRWDEAALQLWRVSPGPPRVGAPEPGSALDAQASTDPTPVDGEPGAVLDLGATESARGAAPSPAVEP